MKHWKKFAAGILVVLLLATTGLAVWQRENLKALYILLTRDSQSISQGMEEKQQAQQEKLEQDFNITIQAPTADQNSDLLDGKLTPEEVKESLGLIPKPEESMPEEPVAKPEETPTKPVPEQPKAEQPKPEEHKPEEPNPEEAEPEKPQMSEEERKALVEATVNQCVAELYAYEVDLMAEMGEMKKTALKDWNYRKAKDRTKDKMIEFGFSWLSEVYKVEARADRNVKAILAEYKVQLEALNASTTVLDDMWKYYCDKKSDTKAYYLNKYLN